MILAFLSRISLRAWAYLAAFFAVLAAAVKIYSASKNAARVEGLEHQLDNVRKGQQIDEAVDKLPDGGAADRLRRDWSRD